MRIPGDRLYSDFHLWVSVHERQATIGLTEYALEELGDIDYIRLPEPGETIVKDQPFGLVETSKAVTDLMAPVSGTVTESNQAVQELPSVLAGDPYGSGWLMVVVASELLEMEELLGPVHYARLVEAGTDQ